jgi:putative two-component system response regulator
MAKILVVDDDVVICLLVQRILEGDGHTVTTAGDGQAGIDAIAADRPDLVVLDLDMPRMSGLEACHRLKQAPATRHLPILILTGRDSRDARVPAWELGADEYLSKPPHPQDLIARVRSLLRTKRLVDELDSAEDVMFAFARTLDAKSRFTLGHSERVGHYAQALGEEIGLMPDEADILRRGALLHDVGKISIPDAILDKPGPLSADEYALVKRHPLEGFRILEGLKSLRAVLPLVRWHHERIDGGGYPDGIRGDAIPLLVRILSVADVYDAVSSERPYRPALAPAKCFDILRADAQGGGLDAWLVEKFCRRFHAAGQSTVHHVAGSTSVTIEEPEVVSTYLKTRQPVAAMNTT